MSRLKSTKFKIYKWHRDMQRKRRIKFPSPAEVEFARLFGAKYITISWIRDPLTGFPYTRFLTLGNILNRELIEREVRVGAMYVDYAQVTPYSRKAIEIDGSLWHGDIVKEQQRDEYLAKYGFNVLHIPAADVYRNKNLVQQRTLNFLAR